MAKKHDIMKDTPRIYKMLQGWWVYAKPTYYSTKLFKLEPGQHAISAISMGQWRFFHTTSGAGWVSLNVPTLRVQEAPEDELREIIRVMTVAKEKYDAGNADSTVDDSV